VAAHVLYYGLKSKRVMGLEVEKSELESVVVAAAADTITSTGSCPHHIVEGEVASS
jgi:hypothetical protein